MEAVLAEFIRIMVGGVTGLATGVAQGITTMATGLFLDTTGTTPVLSAFGGILAIFAGIALAIGITRLVYMFIVSLSAKK